MKLLVTQLYRVNKIPYRSIRGLVEKGILSNKFLKCGTQGFNISKIEKNDYNYVVNNYEEKLEINFINLEQIKQRNKEMEIEEHNFFNLLQYYRSNLNNLNLDNKKLLLSNKLIDKYSFEGKVKYYITKKGRALIEEYEKRDYKSEIKG